MLAERILELLNSIIADNIDLKNQIHHEDSKHAKTTKSYYNKHTNQNIIY